MTVAFSIIIPTRNERNNLKRLLPALTGLYPKSPVFIVDDNSPDDTGGFIRQYSVSHQQVRLILRKNKRGRGSAVLDGLKEALKNKKTDFFLEMDADFSHNPDEIKKLLAVADDNYIIIGSRHIKGGQFVNCNRLRVFLSSLANWYARLILSVPIFDYTNGFRLYPRKSVEILLNERINEKGYIVLSETAFILFKNGFKFKEVPTIFTNRTEGRSNTTILEFLRSIPAIIRIRLGKQP